MKRHPPDRVLDRIIRGAGTALVMAAVLWAVAPGVEGAEAADEPAEASGKEGEKAAAEAAEEESEEKVEFSHWLGGNSDYSGWIDLSVGVTEVEGHPTAFQRRLDLHEGVFGGVRNFGMEKFVGDAGILRIDGQGLGGNEDYKFKVRYTLIEKAYFSAGASRHRSWYDGAGGFHPSTGAWFPLADRELGLDRDSYWFEAGLTHPEWPRFRVRYERQYRHGEKDSTIWGTTTAAAGGRGIAASFRGIDEVRDRLTLDGKHTFGNTTAGLGLNYEHFEADNTLNFRRDAGGPTEDFTTQRERLESDLVNVHGSTVTRFNEKVSFTTGYAFTSLDTDLSGSRIVGNSFDAVFDPSLARFPGYTDLFGGSRLSQHVASLNLVYLPVKTVSIVPSVRIESIGVDSDTFYTATPVAAGSGRHVDSENDYLDLSQRLEVRYTGVTNWVFHARGDWVQGQGDLNERQTAVTTGAVQLQRLTDFDRLTQKYTAGVNWYPRRRLNMAGQYYFKRRENAYDHPIDSTGNAGVLRYPAYLTRQEFDTHDLNYRITYRPFGSLVSVSRYDFQNSTIDTGGAGNAPVESADLTSHIFSQTLAWSPLARLYFQGNFSYVFDTTETPANRPAPGGVVLEAENHYWNAGATVGVALTQRTDLEADYQYYEADNYMDNSSSSQPYGASFREHRLTATLTRRVRENLRVVLGYGYFANSDITYGGFRGYRAHLVHTSLQYRF